MNLVTILCFTIGFTLFITEFQHYREIHYSRKITADTKTEDDTVPLKIKIILPFIDCKSIFDLFSN